MLLTIKRYADISRDLSFTNLNPFPFSKREELVEFLEMPICKSMELYLITEPASFFKNLDTFEYL
jgi:hypothetical protein